MNIKEKCIHVSTYILFFILRSNNYLHIKYKKYLSILNVILKRLKLF